MTLLAELKRRNVIRTAGLYLGQPDRALALLAGPATSDDAFALQMLWDEEGRAARESAAFAGFARKAGLAELWDRYGPPDLCERRAPGDYVCR